ncbi:MAG: Mur ligase family protein [Bifidobacterium sp.]
MWRKRTNPISSFAKYHPEIAIVTNSEADHLDHYGTQENYRAAFVNHVQHAEKSVVMCGDDEGNLAVCVLSIRRRPAYGRGMRRRIRFRWVI